MKVVVTGASGFVGQSVVKELLRQKIDVCAVARRPIDFQNSVVVKNYDEIPVGDILIHLADNPVRAEVNKCKDVYTAEAMNLAKKYTSFGFEKIIFASSASVYGDKTMLPRKETDPVFAVDEYTKAKLACESVYLDAGHSVVRLTNLYGHGMSKYNVFSAILKNSTLKGNVKLKDDTAIRDFLWVDDAANSFSVIALGDRTGVYNIGSSIPVSIADLAEKIFEISRCIDCELEVTNRSLKPSSLVLDISKIKKDFNWVPRITLDEGISLLFNDKKPVE